MRVGVLGGTFDPIHKGHLEMAKQALLRLNLDEVWIMPAGNPPHKSNFEISGRILRFEMCEVACKDESNIKVIRSEFYALRSEPNYTYLSMEKFQKDYPGYEFYFLMGQDSIDYFDQWVEPQRILNACKIGVFLRSESDASTKERCLQKIESLNSLFSGEIIPIFYCPTAISSTEIRRMIENGVTDEELSQYVTKDVLSYIRGKGLYEAQKYFDVKEIKKHLEEKLKPSRYMHTLGVADTAASLAFHYHYNDKKAYMAGLLHDCAKYMSNEELLIYCDSNGLEITAGEKMAPHLLHSKAGAYMAKEAYHIEDEDVLHAILVHTTGCPNMSLLDKIIFVSDYIEPNRDKAKRLTEIRQMSFLNLDFAILMILEDTMDYILGNNQYLDATTKETYEYYVKEKRS